MKFQWDKYMQKINIGYTTLTEINKAFLPFNLIGPLARQVTHLVRILERKTRSLVTTQGKLSFVPTSLLTTHKELESMHLENATLIQRLTDCMVASLGIIL